MSDEKVEVESLPIEDRLKDAIKFVNNRIESLSSGVQDRLERIENKYWDVKENAENRFWLGVWAIVAAFLSISVLVMGANCAYEKQLVVQMVEKGENPVAARCAFANREDTAVCLTYINSVKK